MATQTTNYGLTKPSYNETADIGVINSNMDIIDAKMKEIDNKAGSGGGSGNTDTYGHVKVGSVTIDASGDDTIELVAGSNVTLTPDTTSKSVTISATGGGGGGTSVTVDSELSTTSENPVQNKVITQALNGKGTYSKPTGGIPKTDLASEVQTSLGKADTALQEHQDISGKANKADVTALSNTISDAWDASTTYAVGQYCIYNNLLWKCLVQHSGQTPTEGTYWTKVTVANEITSVNNSLGGFTPIIDSTGKITGYKTKVGADTVFPFNSSDLENATFKTAIDKITDAQIGKKYLIVHSRGTGYVPSVLSGATVLNSKIHEGTGNTAYEGIFIVKATSSTIVMDGGGCPVIYTEI